MRISTGFVEPHFFAGFSGGPKLVTPGLAALHTVKALHNAARIGSPRAVWGVIEGNPVHDAIRAAAALAPPTLSFDVLLNRQHEVSHAFAGDLDATHAEACATAREVAMQEVPHRYPVVVTSNAGFPLDQNLYQAVKGMRSAAQVVAPGRPRGVRRRVQRRPAVTQPVRGSDQCRGRARGAAAPDPRPRRRPCRTSGRCRCSPRCR